MGSGKMALSSTGLIKNESFGRASFTSTDHAPPTTTPTSVSSTKATRPIKISAVAIPVPTYLPQDPTKKSHARKQPHGHVPRPRNAFILFRCDFVRQKKVPDDVENDHRNISRIVGNVWRQMSEREREPWVRMAEREKRLHRKVYPGYRYSPAGEAVGGKKKKRGDVSDGDGDVCAQRRSSSCPPVLPMAQPTRGRVSSRPQVPAFTIIPPTVPAIPDLLSLRRSSSCPPGAPRIASSATTLPDETALLVTRDDLARRPSRVVMYQTSPSPLSFPSPASSSSLFSLDPDQHHHPYTFVRDLGPHTRPVLETGAYRLGPPGDAPGWDSAPRDPVPWSWDELGTLNGAGFTPTFTNPFGFGSGFSGGEEAFASVPFPSSMSVPPHETYSDKVELFSNMGATVVRPRSSTPQVPFNLALLPPPTSSSLRSTPKMNNHVELTGFNGSASTTPKPHFALALSPPPPPTSFMSLTSSSPSSSVPHGFLHHHHHHHRDLTSTSTPAPDNDNDLSFGIPMLHEFSRMSIDAGIVGMGGSAVSAELLGSGYSDCDLGYDFVGGSGGGYFSG